MPTNFYLDESSHGGDMASSWRTKDFNEQPYFVLAAVGVADEASLAEKVAELRVTHRVPPGELKSK